MPTSRRVLLQSGLALGGAVLAPASPTPLDLRPTAAAAPVRGNPFSLGVASGDPWPDGFVIWTRLAHDPLADDGLGGMSPGTRDVRWQVATDERFRRVVASGVAATGPDRGHAVHVELRGLAPGREYFYRFRTGRHLSPVGRSRTAPAAGSSPASLTMCFASCAQWEHGYFTAYRRMAEDEPELVLHLGDYLYEYSPHAVPAKTGDVRVHAGPETADLAGYRRRHAQYKTDPDLQRLHATAPWLVVFDDHEVADNWAGDVPAIPVPGFPARRAAALRAYYENMPLRRTSLPTGPRMEVHRRVSWGQLATFHMLDTRQHRDDQSCGDGAQVCPPASDEARTLLGAAQEAWLADGFARSTQVWDVLGQQVVFSRLDTSYDGLAGGLAASLGGGSDGPLRLQMDAWDGYAACRDRVVAAWQRAGVRNPVVLTGDVHDHYACDVLADWDDPDGEVVATELVTTSVTSNGDGRDPDDGRTWWSGQNPHIPFWTDLRGYVRTRFTATELTADFRCLPQVSVPDAPAFTRASYVVEAGRPGLQQTGWTPLSEAFPSGS